MRRTTLRGVPALVLTGLLSLWSVTVLAAARIDITKVPLGGPFGSGDNVTFQITVLNTGDVPFDAVEVTDPAPRTATGSSPISTVQRRSESALR